MAIREWGEAADAGRMSRPVDGPLVGELGDSASVTGEAAPEHGEGAWRRSASDEGEGDG